MPRISSYDAVETPAGIQLVGAKDGDTVGVTTDLLLSRGSHTGSQSVGTISNFGDGAVAATGAATSRSIKGRFADILNVRDFGAVGDGATDDTAAFNALSAAIRAAKVTADDDYTTVVATIPPGHYSVSSWDMTGMLLRNLHIIADGAVLIGNASNKAVVDCTSSRYQQFHGLTVIGTDAAVPRCGIQLGPKGTDTCGNAAFYGVQVLGDFAVAAFMNLGSETTAHYSCRYINRYASGEYAYIGDGLSQWIPVSDYATVTRTAGTALSMTNNTHVGSQFRNEATGPAVFLANTSGWTFDRNTYYLVFDDAAVVLYGSSASRNGNLEISGLYESSQLTGIQYAVKLVGDGTTTAINGLILETNTPHVDIALFRNDSGGAWRISNAHIKCQTLLQSGAEWFSQCSEVTLDGTIETREAAKLNLDDIAGFSGHVIVEDFSAMGKPVAGSYTAVDSGNKKLFLVGNAGDGGRFFVWDAIIKADGAGTNVELKGRAKGNSNVVLGNDVYATGFIVQANAGTATGITAFGQSSYPRLFPNGAAADIDLGLEGKGAGAVRFGTHSAIGSETVTGFITIKDAGGTARKLAVLS